MKQQTLRLLEALRKRSMTTKQIRDELGIGMPATRVHELRGAGYCIETDRVSVANRFGETCRAAQYTLIEDRKAAA